MTNDHELQFRARMAGASVIPADQFAARLKPPRRSPAATLPPEPDPHDPAFSDLYAAFVAAERGRGRLGDVPSTNPDVWIEQLYGDNVDDAQNAAALLGQYGGKKALEALRDALTHGDARVRAAAILALGQLENPSVVPDLTDRLLHDNASMARQAAAQSLGLMGAHGAMADLETAVKTDTKGKVRKAAQIALAQIRSRRS